MKKDKYLQVKNDFLSGKIKGCKAYFEAHGYDVECAYADIVLGNLSKAEKRFQKTADVDTRAHWGLFLLQMLSGDIISAPTYFEIRNFLEVDLGILLTYCQGNYIEKILKNVDYMAMYNLECYKFIGRAFWAHNYMPAATFYLRKACERMYKDPELHYLLAYINCYNIRNIEACKKELDTCLWILPEYGPACMLKDKLKKENLI